MAGTAIPIALHPRHGVHAPTRGTPRRRPGSVRRTTTCDQLRPDGLDGPLVLLSRGRDLRTGEAGGTDVADRAYSRAVVDFTGGWTLTELATEPQAALDTLLGSRVSSGFRSRLAQAAPELPLGHGVLHQLLDDFPVAVLVSGHAYGAGQGGYPRSEPTALHGRPGFRADQCAGFATGGTIMNGLATDGRPPLVTGPEAPPLTGDPESAEVPDDPQAWHTLDPLPAHAMRRHRRIDVVPAAGPGARASVDAFFRDSYVRPDGVETIIHEYTVEAEFEPETGVLTACEAQARVLPWVECPVAAAGAGRLVGRPLEGLRAEVRTDFTGTSTCTHLNDTLRALEDVPHLLRLATVTSRG